MRHRLAYLICATPRSGTTLLCDLLNSTGRAGKPQSYFRRQDIERRAESHGLRAGDFLDMRDFDRAYLDAVLREGSGGTDVFGLRIMWGTVAEIAERLGWLHPQATPAVLFEKVFGPSVYVHISRRDKVAQAISLLKAEQSGLWHRAADGSERQRTGPEASAHYDADRIAALIAELEHDDAAWNAFFARHELAPVRVGYDALVTNPRAEVRKILDALGLPSALADSLEAQTSKMADSESETWGERFRRERGPR